MQLIFASHSLTHSSRSLNDRWDIKDDRVTTFFHCFRRASPNPNTAHSDILSSHLFFCLPFLLPPCIVPCRIIFASPVDLVMCPYYLNLRFLAVVIRFPFLLTLRTKESDFEGRAVHFSAFLATNFIFRTLDGIVFLESVGDPVAALVAFSTAFDHLWFFAYQVLAIRGKTKKID